MTHLDELPGGEFLSELEREMLWEAKRIYDVQAGLIEDGLQTEPAPCQMQKADMYTAIAEILMIIRAEGLELANKRKAGSFGAIVSREDRTSDGKPKHLHLIREELIGRLISGARVKMRFQRQKREPKQNDSPAADTSNPGTVEA